MTRAAFRAYQVEQCVGRWRKGIASDAMAIVRSHDDTAGGEMSFTAALDGPKKTTLLAQAHAAFLWEPKFISVSGMLYPQHQNGISKLLI